MVSEPLKSLIGAGLCRRWCFQMPPPSVPAHSVRVVGVPVLSTNRSFTQAPPGGRSLLDSSNRRLRKASLRVNVTACVASWWW